VPESPLAALLEQCVPFGPSERAAVLENSSQLEEIHKEAARQGDSAVPTSAEDEVDYHYVCFVQSQRNRHLYELDGSRKGPIDTGVILPEEGGDILADTGRGLIKEFIAREQGNNANFSLMALIPA
jgi:ubiquitin carboxyl-terminal hydrolase L3